MPEIGPSGSEGGVARQRHPYPYRPAAGHGRLFFCNLGPDLLQEPLR